MLNKLSKFFSGLDIKAILVLLLIVYAIFATKGCLNKDDEANRWQNNYTSLANRDDKADIQTFITKEISKYLPYLDSILKVSKIKNKNVQQVFTTNYHNHYHGDTIIQDLHADDADEYYYPFHVDTNCFVIDGAFRFNPASNEDLKMLIHNLRYDEKITSIYYRERNSWKLLFFKTKLFGKWKNQVKTVSLCGDTIHVSRFDFMKNN